MQDRSANLRRFFARYVTACAQVRDARIEEAFGAVPREPFAGPGPWSVHLPGVGYIPTPDADLAFNIWIRSSRSTRRRGSTSASPALTRAGSTLLACVKARPCSRSEREPAITPRFSPIWSAAMVAFTASKLIAVRGAHKDELETSAPGRSSGAVRHCDGLPQGRRGLGMRGRNAAELVLARRLETQRKAFFLCMRSEASAQCS